MSPQKLLPLLAIVLSCFTGYAAAGGDAPAVSALSGKFSLEGGTYDWETTGLALSSLAVPVAHAVGAQFDTAAGTIDGKIMGGAGVHLFTRDPSSHLLGIYGSYHSWGDINIWRVATEAEFYLGRFTLGGIAGHESIEGLSDDGHFFAHTDLAYYVTEDFKIYGGYRFESETSFGAAGGEYLFRAGDVPLSVFASSSFGDDDYTRVTGGLKIYFGDSPNKSLLARHRTSDPDNYTPVFPNRSPRSRAHASGPVDCSNPANSIDLTCICQRDPKNRLCTTIVLP